MKKNIIIIAITGILILTASILMINISNNKVAGGTTPKINESSELNNNSNLTVNKFQTLSEDQANVTVEITPKELGADKEKNIFEVIFNTHSVELDFDFDKTITLEDDLGNTYTALEWTGNRGGHHVSGDIIFPGLDNNAKEITLKIIDIADVARSFKWEL